MTSKAICLALCGALAACSATPIHLPHNELGAPADAGAPDFSRGWDMLSGGLDMDLEADNITDAEIGVVPKTDAVGDAQDAAGEGPTDGAGEGAVDGDAQPDDLTQDDATPPDDLTPPDDSAPGG